MASISALKKRRNSLQKLQEQMENLDGSTKKSYGDDRIWKLNVDKAGNGYAVIRFLPEIDGEPAPFVKMISYGFKGPKGDWYLENSRVTLGEADPVSDYNKKLWNSGSEADKDDVRKRRINKHYYSNIYVVKDPANPENEGKVFLFRYGASIYKKIKQVLMPEFEGDEAIPVFDFWEGANLKLRARNNEAGLRNYDASSFDTPGPMTDPSGRDLSDEEMEAIWNQQYSLQEIIDPKNFKSYEELQARFYRVLGLGGGQHAPNNKAGDDEPAMEFAPNFKERAAPEAQAAPSRFETQSQDFGDDDDDSLDFFKSLAEGD
jgi:hypothetical protein